MNNRLKPETGYRQLPFNSFKSVTGYHRFPACPILVGYRLSAVTKNQIFLTM